LAQQDVWAISMSAFFADLGYQTVQAGFPLFLVLTLHQPVWEYGLASAISYGGGAMSSYLGARLGNRIGHRRLAFAGNSAIPLLSFCALVSNPAWAIGMLSGGWWARNLRSPSRRVRPVEAVSDERLRSDAFGFLHALDVGGGALAGGYLLLAVDDHVAFRCIFVATAIPLVLSTLSSSRTTAGTAAPSPRPAGGSAESANPPGARNPLTAAAPYGFTFYSAGSRV
jgi:MFS family permease